LRAPRARRRAAARGAGAGTVVASASVLVTPHRHAGPAERRETPAEAAANAPAADQPAGRAPADVRPPADRPAPAPAPAGRDGAPDDVLATGVYPVAPELGAVALERGARRPGDDRGRRLGADGLRRAADRRLASVVEGMSDAFLSLDADWRVTYANRECARLNGTTARALVGCDHWARWPETVGSEVERQYRRAAAEGVPVRFTHHYPQAGAWHDIHAYPAEGGGLAVFFRDVTAEQRAQQERERLLAAERAARAAAERLQTTTAALAAALTPDQVSAVIADAARAAVGADAAGVGTVSADGRVLVYRAMRGFPDAWNRAYDGTRLDADSPLAEAVRTGAPVYLETPAEWEARFPALAAVHRAGGFEAAAALPCATDTRVVGGVALSFRGPRAFGADERALLLALAQQGAAAFERATLYAEAEAARRRADEANRAKGEFLAVMSHELRTPLNAIGGYAELMELGLHGPVTPEQLQALERVRRAQRHLLGLINGVLNYAKVDAGAVHYAVEEVPLDEVLAACASLMAPQVRAKGLALRQASRPVRALADREKVQQVVLNLLSNAVKFTDAGGEVTLEGDAVAGAAGLVRVRVADTGRGIPAGQLERVFQPFVQVDARLTRAHEGTGLGLAISRDLARGMGGDLAAESEPGRGSTFTLTLRAAPG
jgi:PAS domain S-box-containing protein